MAADGTYELARLGARLQAEGDGALRVRTQRALRAAAQPLVPKVRTAALTKLPKAGGLNQVIAGHKISVVTSFTGRNVGVRIKTQNTLTDTGVVRRPSWPRGTDRSKWKWADQAIPQAVGWWSQTLRDSSPQVSAVLNRMVSETASIIEGS